MHHKDVEEANPAYKDFSNKPNAAILSYPVITSGEFAHQGSFDALIGFNPTEEDKRYYSLELQVNEDVPPCFLWQTVNDETVPVEYSYLFAEALKAQKTPYAHHVFSEGRHGLSTADEAFGRSEFGKPYTMEQTFRVTEGVKSGRISVAPKVREMMEFYESQGAPSVEANEEASVWTEMARIWLDKYM